MNLNISNKKVLVTGGASGIGKSIVEHFFNEGATVAFIDKNQEKTAKFVAEIGSPYIFGYVADLSDEEKCELAVNKCLEFLGGLDILVNNAGINDKVGITSSITDFKNSLTNNLVHYFHVTKLCIPSLKETKGCVVNIGSKVATTGQGGTSGYAAAKGGIQALTREWAVEFAKDSIRVNAVVPAEVWTPLYESWINTFDDPDQALSKIKMRVPLEKRLTETKEISHTVLFLASKCASHITGQFIYVDGGYVHLDRAL